MEIKIEDMQVHITDSTESEYLLDGISSALADNVSISCCTCSCCCCC